MSNILAEPKHAGSFILSEAPHTRSRDNVTILAGSGSTRALTVGMVLGARLTGTAAATADAGNTGNGAMGAITVSGDAEEGRYRLVCIEPGSNVGTFALLDPDGVEVGRVIVATAFSAAGLAFTLADGATDFVAGDAFTIEVTKTARKYLQLDVAAATGEAEAAGVLIYDVDALDAVDAKGVIMARDCELNAGRLTWPAGISAANKANAILQLERLGIILR